MLSRWQGIDAIWNAIVARVFTLEPRQPRRVLVGRVELPVLVLDAIYFNLSKELASKIGGGEVRRIRREVPALSVDIINVDASERFHHLDSIVAALRSQVSVILNGNSGEIALVSLNLVSERLRHQHSVVENVVRGRRSVESPVRDAVAYHEACQVDLVLIRRLVLVVLVDLVGKKRNVDASVRLARNVDRVRYVRLVFEAVEPAKKDLEVVMCAAVVGVRAILRSRQVVAGRKANACRLLDVQDVGLVVPGPLVGSVGRVAVPQYVGAGLLQEAEHRGAARASVEPDEQWSRRSVLLRLKENVVDALAGTGDIDESRVDSERSVSLVWPSGQRIE